jgi:hypothetical protein
VTERRCFSFRRGGSIWKTNRMGMKRFFSHCGQRYKQLTILESIICEIGYFFILVYTVETQF